MGHDSPLTSPDEPVDPFSPDALRVTGDIIPAEKVLTAVPVRRPKRSEFFRVRAGGDWSLDAAVIELDDIGETYVVAPSCLDAVDTVARRVRLFTCINRGGTLFLWPAKLPVEGGGAGNRYSETGLKIADAATRSWVRMWGDRGLGAYMYSRAKGNLDDPAWPDHTFGELLSIAFGDGRMVDGPGHPVIRQLNGEL